MFDWMARRRGPGLALRMHVLKYSSSCEAGKRQLTVAAILANLQTVLLRRDDREDGLEQENSGVACRQLARGRKDGDGAGERENGRVVLERRGRAGCYIQLVLDGCIVVLQVASTQQHAVGDKVLGAQQRVCGGGAGGVGEYKVSHDVGDDGSVAVLVLLDGNLQRWWSNSLDSPTQQKPN